MLIHIFVFSLSNANQSKMDGILEWEILLNWYTKPLGACQAKDFVQFPCPQLIHFLLQAFNRSVQPSLNTYHRKSYVQQ